MLKQAILVILLPLSLFAQNLEQIDVVEVGAGNAYFVQKARDGKGKDYIAVQFMKATASELAQVAPAKIRELYRGRKHVLGDVAKRFPVESAAFFVAIGALNYWEMINNFSKNPLSQAQHIESLSDPVAHAGFAAFMYVNGEVNQFVGKSIQNPTFQKHFLPYVGMSAGLMASNIVHEVFHDQDLMQCWKFSKIKVSTEHEKEILKDEACDRAYDNWVKHWHEKAYSWAPSLASLMASTFITGKISHGWKAVGNLIKAYGVDAVMMVGPQGPWLTFGKQIVNFGVFTYIDWIINPYIKTPFNNLIQSKDFSDISDKLFKGILRSKANGWQPMYLDNSCTEKSKRDNEAKCRYEFTEDLKEFKRMKKRWRDMNLEDVMTAHNSWAEMVNGISGQFAFAAKTYTTLINYFNKPDMQPNLLFQGLPFWGVSPGKDNEGKDKELLLVTTKNYVYTDAQIRHIRKVTDNFPIDLTQHNKEDRALIEKILRLLGSAQTPEIIEGIKLLNTTLGIGKTNQYEIPPTPSLIWLRALRNEIGNPWPSMRFGEAFSNYNDFTQKVSQNKTLQNWRLPIGMIPAQSPTQKLIANMICGPRDAYIVHYPGFQPFLVPPKIVDTKEDPSVCFSQPGYVPNISFFDFKVDIHNSPLNFIHEHINRKHYDPRGPVLWWDVEVDSILLDWFEKQKPVYEELVVKLLEAFQRPKDHAFNKNEFVPNNIAESMEQEFKVYAVVLGELLRDEKNLKRDPKVYDSLFSGRESAIVISVPLQGGDLAHISGLPFLKMVRHNMNLNFNDLLGMYRNHQDVHVRKLVEKNKSDNRELLVHKELMDSLKSLQALFQKIQIRTTQLPVGYFDFNKKYKKEIVGNVLNSQFEGELEKLSKKLEAIAKAYSPYFDTVFANQVFELTLTGMMEVASSYAEYGEVINLMNVEARRAEDGNHARAASERFNMVNKKCVQTTGSKVTKKADDGCKP